MTQGPGSSDDGAVDGKFSRIAFSGTMDSNHIDRPSNSRAPLRLLAALGFAALLALAPHPAFAQHGGGGGGHAGGGGFGGSHGGGFGGGHASGGGSRGGGAPAAHGGSGGSSSGNASGNA